MDVPFADRGPDQPGAAGHGLITSPLELLYNNFSVLIGLVYGEIPFMILPFYASLEKLDLSLLEASADLGAPRASTFLRVTVPLTMPGIVAGIILVFVPSLGQFIVSDLLGGARTILAGNLIQNQFAVARNKPFGSAVAFELTAAVLALLFAYCALHEEEGAGGAAVSGRGRLLAAHTWLVYVFLYAPIAILVLFSFNKTQPDRGVAGIHAGVVREPRAQRADLDSVRNSLVVGVAATTVATVFGTLAALALGRYEFRGKGLTRNLLYLPIIIPEIVVGAALVTFFGVAGLRLSLSTVVIAHVVFSVSYVAIVVRARLSGFDRSLEEAALDLGAPAAADVLAGDATAHPAGHRVGRAAGVHGLDRRLRDHLFRGRGGRDDPSAADLLDAQGGRDAGGQRGLDPAAGADDHSDHGRAATAAATAGRGPRLMRLLRMAAVLVVAAASAAVLDCGGRKEPGADSAAAHEKKLNLYIWSSYMPQDVLDDFTKQTGITVHYDLYDSNEPVLEKLQSGVADYDLVVPSDYMVRILIHLNLLQPLVKERLEGFGNLDPRFLNKGFDPANRYSLPYVWGTTGFGYSAERVKSRPNSWAPLFDPANKGQILMLDDMRECFSVALKYMGESINTRDPAILKKAAELLKKQKSLVKTYNSSDFENILASGDVTYAHGYNGQIAKVMAANPGRFGYVVPKEGATIWVDSVCVPAQARHTDATLRLPELHSGSQDQRADRQRHQLRQRQRGGAALHQAGDRPGSGDLCAGRGPGPVRVHRGHWRGDRADGRVLDGDQGAVRECGVHKEHP